MANKTQITYSANGVASGTTTTETAITLRKSSGTNATTTGTSFVITSQKTFVITSVTVACKGHNTATAQQTVFNFRINTGGAVTTSSTPIIFSIKVATQATANHFQSITIPLYEGYELYGDGSLQFGVTANATFTTNAPTWDVLLTGYEY